MKRPGKNYEKLLNWVVTNQLTTSHRILAVFDEIHHCAGSELGATNSWGEEVLLRIQHKATYTLALTGTPWRSDRRPIVLADYSNPDGQVQCDFVYGLKEAIQDQVCRSPSIVLIDNERLKVDCLGEVQEFSGVAELLKKSEVSYQHLLLNLDALRYCLSLGCSRLRGLRKSISNAGGLVVASSVSHAEMIAELLKVEFRCSVSVVVYKYKDSKEIIDRFRRNDDEWIVSVGMISEGTDIPRLQVCCYLSRITTELYFRQVLGRILRMTGNGVATAWLYTLAEPQLVEYAQRVAKDLPEQNILTIVPYPSGDLCFGPGSDCNEYHNEMPVDSQETLAGSFYCDQFGESHLNSLPDTFPDRFSLVCLGAFRQKLLEYFGREIKTTFSVDN
ncbi:DEAD/DEAH box helicase [Hahella ganghwensis]|uniref:DEAD/DEAH box helicase n=1 Tax=Hahella ganghwensis TaxID=286420 RepID=UPI00035EDB8D|nr:helicase-related protein [Hahella ganghwensis]